MQVTGVPLILYHHNRIPQRLRVEEPVQLLDLMPTILEFADVDSSGMTMQGDSLVGLIEGRNPDYWKARVIASEEVTTRDRSQRLAQYRPARLRLAVLRQLAFHFVARLLAASVASCRNRCD